MDDKRCTDCCVMRDRSCDSKIIHLMNMSQFTLGMSVLYFKLGVQMICLFVIL